VSDLRGIIREYLVWHRYDGLAGNDCGCEIDDLMPCDNPSPCDCVPGHRHECREDECRECETSCGGFLNGAWVMRAALDEGVGSE
jgi:hypothetical protein